MVTLHPWQVTTVRMESLAAVAVVLAAAEEPIAASMIVAAAAVAAVLEVSAELVEREVVAVATPSRSSPGTMEMARSCVMCY